MVLCPAGVPPLARPVVAGQPLQDNICFTGFWLNHPSALSFSTLVIVLTPLTVFYHCKEYNFREAVKTLACPVCTISNGNKKPRQPLLSFPIPCGMRQFIPTHTNTRKHVYKGLCRRRSTPTDRHRQRAQCATTQVDRAQANAG